MIKTLKKVIILIVTISIMMCSNNVYALSDIKGKGDEFISQGTASSPITTDDAWSILRPLAQILLGVATIVLVITYMYLGIQYMMTDPNGKANIKQKLIALVIATVLVYGGIGIFTIIINIFNSIFA